MVDLTAGTIRWPDAALELFRRGLAASARGQHPLPEHGDDDLRMSLAAELGCDPRQLRIIGRVRDVAAALGRLHRPIIVERPTFLGVPESLAPGATWRYATWQEIASAPDRAVIWLTTPYRNPDGACMSPGTVAEIAGQSGRTVVCNETYRWYGQASALPASAVRVGSLHKLAGPWSKIGWLITHAGVGWPAMPDETLPAPEWQRAWARFLRLGGLELLKPGASRAVESRREFEDAAGMRDGKTGPFRVLRAADGISERSLVSHLARNGVKVSPGAAFVTDHPACRLYFTGVTRCDAARAGRIVRSAALCGLAQRD